MNKHHAAFKTDGWYGSVLYFMIRWAPEEIPTALAFLPFIILNTLKMIYV